MKRTYIYCLFASAALFISCSSDSETNSTKPGDIIGTWDAYELIISENSATDNVKFARDILDHLTDKDCYIITFRFNEDLSVIAENSLDHLEINVNQEGTGLDIPCPAEKDMDFTTYTYDGKILTYIDDNAMPVDVKATISQGKLFLDAAELDLPSLDEGGQLVFLKR